MKKLNLIVLNLLMALVLLSSSCDKCLIDKRVKGDGDLNTENRSCKDFTKLNIEGVFDVELIQGDEYQVLVEAQSNLFQHIETNIAGEVLNIKIEDDIKIKRSKTITIYVTMPDVERIDFSGVGDFRTKGNVELEDLTVIHSGVGDIEMNGNTKTLNVTNSGVGDVDLLELKSEIARINTSGVGDMKFYVTSELYLKSTGVGNVYYKGDAIIKEMEQSGVGKVKKEK